MFDKSEFDDTGRRNAACALNIEGGSRGRDQDRQDAVLISESSANGLRATAWLGRRGVASNDMVEAAEECVGDGVGDADAEAGVDVGVQYVSETAQTSIFVGILAGIGGVGGVSGL